MLVVVVLVVGLYFFDEQLEATAVAFEQHYCSERPLTVQVIAEKSYDV